MLDKSEFIKVLKELTILTLITAFIISAFSPAVANASDVNFYSANDILTYDKDACGVTNKQTGTSGISAVTKEQKIAQTFIVGFTPTDTVNMKSIVNKYKIGGLFPVGGSGNSSDNDGLNKQLFDELNIAAGAKLFIASDDEGGQVARFTKGTTPSASVMGTMTADEAGAEGVKSAKILVSRGLNGDLAPVLDIATPGTPWTQSERNWSSSPDKIIENAGAFAKGLKENGIKPVYKHFPGIGKVTENTDFKKTAAQSLASLTEDLKPYRELANKNDGAIMMSNGYVSDWGDTPVGINKKAVDYLRNDIKFTGTIMTDALNALSADGYGSSKVDLSTAIVESLKAGVDMPLFVPANADTDISAAIKAVSDSVDDSRIDEAYDKSLKLRGLTSATPEDEASASECCSVSDGGGSINLPGNNNTEKILSFLMNLEIASGVKMNLAQASGLTGNFFVEAGGTSSDGSIPEESMLKGPNTAIVNTAPDSGASGIAQWLGSRLNGQNGLKTFASSNGKDWTDLEIQLRFLAWELGIGEEWNGSKGGSESRSLAGIIGRNDPAEVAIQFEALYERCNCSIERRAVAAKSVYAYYVDKGAIPGSGSTANQPSLNNVSYSANGSSTVVLDVGAGGNISQYTDEKSGLADSELFNSSSFKDRVDIANIIKTDLETGGYNVIMTKSSNDSVVNRRIKVDEILSGDADIVVSIQTNNSSLNEVWPQRVNNYREFNGKKLSLTNESVSKLSQTYAEAISKARQTTEGGTIGLDSTNSSQAGFFENTPSKGNISLEQLWGQDKPWVYSQISQDGPNSTLTNDKKQKYASGLISGIKASIPAAKPNQNNDNCSDGGSSSGDTGSKIADMAIGLSWPNRGKHKGTDKSMARETYQIAMPKYNLQQGTFEWTDCGVFVATAIRASDADKDYAGRNTATQNSYLSSSGKFTKVEATDSTQLKPGDIGISSFHTFVYTGPFRGDDGVDYHTTQASLGDHPPEAGQLLMEELGEKYNFWRLK